MTVDAHINKIAMQARVRDVERERIDRSMAALAVKLKQYFGADLKRQFVFGSYARKTILPRKMDPQSDVDWMILFEDADVRPQTYLNRLRRFAEQKYSTSEIAQSNPTIVLNLNHIRFELVPAIKPWLSGLQIPAKASDYEDWISTNPTDVNDGLTEKNAEYKNLIKPMVRVLKYWNATAGYPYESFELEKKVINHGFGLIGMFSPPTIRNLLFHFINNLHAGLFTPKRVTDAISRAQEIISRVHEYEASSQHDRALREIRRLLPGIE